MLTRSIEALDRVNRVLSDENIKTFSAALSDTQAVTAELRERKSIVADLQSAVQRADEALAVGAVLALALIPFGAHAAGLGDAFPVTAAQMQSLGVQLQRLEADPAKASQLASSLFFALRLAYQVS